MLKSTLKRNKGITLIALVVTIIVLLILAGISIAMLTGQNGILNRATEAKEKTGVAQEDESQKLKGYEDTINQYAPGSNGGSGGGSKDETPGVGELPETAEGQPADTQIKNPASYGTNPNAQATADGNGKYFAKPEGANYVTGTVDEGVVVNIKGSEFVWVPVDDVVLDTSRAADLPKSSSEGISSKKTYTPMAVQDGNDYKGILYEFSGSNGWLRYGSNSSTNYQGGSALFREPDIVSYDTGDYKSEGITPDILASEYNDMIVSLLKYKGFYVARYEAGLDENKNIVFKNASVAENKVTTANAGNSETYRWYGLYKKIKTFATKENNEDKVVSSMIWGSQYDAMMNWMAKKGKTVGSEDSTKKNSAYVTGKSPNDIINNVYDLYGCHLEWTLEAYDSYYRAKRGGNSGGNYSPASRGYDLPNSTKSDYSSRATLYIK